MVPKLNVIVFILALALLCVLLFLLPADPNASQAENRSMAELPQLSIYSFTSGRYMDDLESYLSDSIAYRTLFIDFTSTAERLYGVSMGGATYVSMDDAEMGLGIIPVLYDGDDDPAYDPSLFNPVPPAPSDSGLPPVPDGSAQPPLNGSEDLAPGNPAGSVQGGSEDLAPDGPADTEPDDPSDFAPDSPEGSVQGGSSDFAVDSSADFTQDGSASHPQQAPEPRSRVNPGMPFSVDVHYSPDAVLYNGYRYSESAAVSFADALGLYRESLPDSVRIFNLMTPTLVEFMEERYRAEFSSQSEALARVDSMLRVGIHNVDAYSMLAAHAANEYLFFRTDHHWTALGAYYAYLAFAEAAGLPAITIDNYVEYSIPDFIGSLARGTTNRAILRSPDTLYYYQIDTGVTYSQRLFYLPQDGESPSYGLFLGGDRPIFDFTTSNRNGKTLVALKSSQGNAFIPWVAPHYERIVAIDPRSYEGSIIRLIQQLGEVDLLLVFMMTPTTYTSTTEQLLALLY